MELFVIFFFSHLVPNNFLFELDQIMKIWLMLMSGNE